MLTQTLRQLERDGVVVRTIYASVPPKVEYSLTELGHTLVRILDAIRKWSENNIKDVLNARNEYDKKNASKSPDQ
jgi:DNA-binding HxlR family transcriptional regulator